MEKLIFDEKCCQAEMQRALGENSAAVIHELRGPLAALSANVQTLERQLLRRGISDYGERFHALYAETERMKELLDQYLLLSAPRPPRLQALDTAQCAGQVFQLLRALLLRQGVNPRLQVEGASRPVWADERQVKQILYNLVINALDALPEQGGRLELLIRPAGAWQALELSDNGCGVDEHDMERLFERFYTTKVQGSGLGLPISRQLALAAGGDLRVARNADGGCTFTLLLPFVS